MSTNYINRITDTAGTTHDIAEGVDTRIFRGTSISNGSDQVKVVTLDDSTGFSLTSGVRIAVTFNAGNTATSPQLNVNSTGAKNVMFPIGSTTNQAGDGDKYNSWSNKETVIFTYDGYGWVHGGSSLGIYRAYNLAASKGSGTVTSVGISNATDGGLSVSGSPVTGSGSITVGHSNILTNAQTTQAVYPIAIDKNGHISSYGTAITISNNSNWVNGSASGSVRTAGSTEESSTYTIGVDAVAEGHSTKASGYAAHAEGYATIASGMASHAEGYGTASGNYSHAEGDGVSSGTNAHAEGYSTASGSYAHAEGYRTIAQRKSQHVFGEYNVADTTGADGTVRGTYVEIVGKGTSDSNKSNARTLDWSGNETLAGKLTLGAAPTANMDAATKQYVDTQVATRQATLVSGTNIKTINNTSILGSGDISISSGGGADSIELVLGTTGWNHIGNAYYLDLELQNVGDYDIFIVSPYPLHQPIYTSCGIYLSEVYAGRATFVASSVPSIPVKVQMVHMVPETYRYGLISDTSYAAFYKTYSEGTLSNPINEQEEYKTVYVKIDDYAPGSVIIYKLNQDEDDVDKTYLGMYDHWLVYSFEMPPCPVRARAD